MKKHIKVQAAILPNFDQVLVRVLEQTHKGAAFGKTDNRFVASNGIVLASNNRPARDKDDANVVWLQGAQVAKNNKSIAISAARWKKVAAAIQEYNAYEFAARGAAPAPRPAADPCAVIIG